MSKANVFIASSAKGTGFTVAQALASNLENLPNRPIEVHPWYHAIQTGHILLSSVSNEITHCDCCIIVVSGDDATTDGVKTTHHPRPNIVFEAGLSIGLLGPDRTLLVYDSQSRPSIPSDLDGLVYLPANFDDPDLGAITACVSSMIARDKPFDRAIGRELHKETWSALGSIRSPCREFPNEQMYTDYLGERLVHLSSGSRFWAVCGDKAWTSPAVKRYFEDNKSAAAKGVHISRVFVHRDRPQAPADEVEAEKIVLGFHRSVSNMTAYTMEATIADPIFDAYHIPPDFGFAVWDGGVMIHWGLKDCDGHRGGRFYVAPALIWMYERLFLTLRRRGVAQERLNGSTHAQLYP